MATKQVQGTRRNGWTIYGKENGAFYSAGAHLWLGNGPPEDWTTTWPELFDTTEFSPNDFVEVGMLGKAWNGHTKGSVAVANWTRSQIAIHVALQPTVTISLRKG